MNLIIDIGNTRTKTAVFDSGGQMLFYQPVPTDTLPDFLEDLLQRYPVTHAGISQVGKQIDGLEAFLQNHGVAYIFINTGLNLPFQTAYRTPESLGADRLALVAGAVYRQKNKNTLIIDAGTCVTYDFIDRNNVYHGGAISPGLQLRYKALNDYTEKLPLLKTPPNKINLTGDDTQTSIHSGVIYGLANEIEGFIVKYNLKFDDLTVYLTGGDQKVLDSYIKNMIFVSSKFLLLEGINHLLNLNK